MSNESRPSLDYEYTMKIGQDLLDVPYTFMFVMLEGVKWLI